MCAKKFAKITKIAILLGLAWSGQALALEPPARVLYLANEGVLIVQGDVKILFDPLFDTTYGQYQRVPQEMEQDLLAGAPPFDGIDAVFVSHHHGDHFAPELMLSFLNSREKIKLYAPAQAVAALHSVANAEDQAVFERVTGFALEYTDEPITLTVGKILIEAVRIPHSGWPRRMTDIENISFRVTLNDGVTVLHMGDADPNPEHFSMNTDYWAKRDLNLALPPYWFFVSSGGRVVLSDYLKPGHAIGIHVPESMPDDPARRPDEFSGYDLFTEPGESRDIPTRN